MARGSGSLVFGRGWLGSRSVVDNMVVKVVVGDCGVVGWVGVGGSAVSDSGACREQRWKV